MSSHVTRIENRVEKMRKDRENKLEILSSSFQPSFTPRINKKTDKLLEESSKRV